MKTQAEDKQMTTEEILASVAAEMMGNYDMSDVSVEQPSGFPHIKIYHPMTFEGSAPEGTREGQFFSIDTAMQPTNTLTMVVYQTKDQRICGSKTVKQGGGVYCRCLDQKENIGFPYVKEGDKSVMGDTPRDCSLCPHNTFHAQGKGIVLLPPLNDDARCKSTKVWGGFLLSNPDNITLATVTPVTLGVGAGALASIYRKDLNSWYGAAETLKVMAKDPLPWHSVVMRVTTKKFKFEAGSTHLPMFEIIAGGMKIFSPMKAIVATIGNQLMLSTGRGMDVKALTGLINEDEYNPTMTGTPSTV